MSASGPGARRLEGVARTFFIGLIVAFAAAWAAPALGARDGVLHAGAVATVGIMVIFFFQGLQLPGEQLAQGLLAWRFHLFVQLSGYVVFPLLTWGVLTAAGALLPPELRLGFFYLAILPSTISSAVILVAAANGNVSAAILSTALSNVLGVFIVPAACAWQASIGATAHVPAGLLLWKVVQLLLLPLAVGQILRPWFKSAVAGQRPRIAAFSNYVILFLVYAAFCDSIAGGTWKRHGPAVALWAGGGAFLLLLLSTALVWAGARALGFVPAMRVTALFCASQKTLAAGVPLAGVIFSNLAAHRGGQAAPDLGVILLPLMFYHPMQLTLGSLLLPWLHRASDAPPASG